MDLQIGCERRWRVSRYHSMEWNKHVIEERFVKKDESGDVVVDNTYTGSQRCNDCTAFIIGYQRGSSQLISLFIYLLLQRGFCNRFMSIKAVSTRWLRVRIHHHQYHVCPRLNLFTLQTHFMHLERTPSICHDSRGSPVCGRLSNPLVEVKYHSCTLSVQSAIDSSVTLTQASM